MSNARKTNPYVIVVGYDMSDEAEKAIEQAVELANPHSAVELHVLGVLDDRRSLGRPAGHRYDYRAAEEVRDTIREAVGERLTDAGTSGLSLFVHARIGSPADELVQLAREAQADILVVGTHGRSGVGRILLGSVAEKVVRFAPCPVLVARAHTQHREASAEFQPDPPCPTCTETRKATAGATWWCELHSKEHVPPHIFSYSSGIAQKRPDSMPIS